VTEAELLERLDAHIARGNDLTEAVREEMALSRETHEDLRAFTREITLRNEKVWREVVAGLTDTRRAIREDLGGMRESLGGMRESLGGMRESLGGMGESLRDMADAIRANTKAVLKLLDRLEGNGAGA